MADVIVKTRREHRRDQIDEAVKLGNQAIAESGFIEFKAVRIGDELHVVRSSAQDMARILGNLKITEVLQEEAK